MLGMNSVLGFPFFFFFVVVYLLFSFVVDFFF